MVERPPTLTRQPVPRRRRPRPSRAKMVLRRLGALGVMLGGLALAAWLGTAAVSSVRSDPPPPPPPVPKAPPPLRILFPEGFTREDMADRITAVNEIARTKRKVRPKLAKREYLRLTAGSKLPAELAGDGKTRALEGLLFPATYEFTRRTTTKQLVNKQLQAFRKNWAKVDLAYARSKKLTPYDVLVIASMIEKEVTAPDERPLVAAVIYNRLKIGMPLGIDATIRYALRVPPTESLRVSQLQNPTPYNTRIHLGLPPTPIANPGLASMQAAAHPASVKYLYFVRKPDKVHHFFTANEQEFFDYQRRHGY